MEFLIESTNLWNLVTVYYNDILVTSLTIWDVTCVGCGLWILKVYENDYS